MAENIVGVITNMEDDSYGGKDFKKVTLGTGETLKVKQGKKGALMAKWDLLEVGKGIKFIMKDYTTPENVKMPFVDDIETVEGVLPAAVKPVPPKEYVDEPPPKPAPPVNTKNKAFGLSYTKDLVVAGKVDLNNILFYAEMFTRFMDGTITVPEEIIVRKVASMVRLEKKETE